MRKAVLTILLASAISAPVMLAQAPANSGNGHNGANRVARQIKYLTTMLDLSSDQQAQLTTVFTNANAADQPLHQSLRAARQQFEADRQSNPGNLTADADAVSKIQSQLMVNNATTDAQVKGILSAAQYTKYQGLHGRGAGGWGGGRGDGGPGGPGPDGPQ
jgi:Spy/CpxP family protein refolding chaperone